MSINRKGNLILFTGSSGVGKGTIIKELLDRDKNIRLSVSNTTREPREGEIDGVHYNFLTREQFNDVLKKDGYLEHAEFCGNLYGTPKKQVEDMLNQGYDVLLEIEVKGGLQILDKYPDILSIFILPPSMESLERRLRRRGTEDEETIRKRLAQAAEEISYKDRYKYNVVNGDLETAINEVLDILHKEDENLIKYYTKKINIKYFKRRIIMHKVDVDSLLQGKQSKYALVVGVAKRAREITQTFEEEQIVTEDKPVLIAIKEIEGHEINILEPDEDEL